MHIWFPGDWCPVCGDGSMKNVSILCFSLALASTLLLPVFISTRLLTSVAIGSVIFSALLTYLIPIRLVGLVGVSGLSIVYILSGGNSIPGNVLIFLTVGGIALAVLFTILDDLSYTYQGEKDEI